MMTMYELTKSEQISYGICQRGAFGRRRNRAQARGLNMHWRYERCISAVYGNSAWFTANVDHGRVF